MEKNLLFVFLIPFAICFSPCKAQNLVPNPSFEQYSLCPDGLDQMSRCIGWSAFRASPDYFNTCSPVYQMAPPYAAWSFQYPHTGNAYAAFISYTVSFPNYREHCGVQLMSSLVIGTKYYISFYVSTGYDSLYSNIACNKIGALLTTYQYSEPETTTVALPNACTIKEDSIITDTIKWVKVFGSFVADSAYQYLVIGNFFDDNSIDTLQFPFQIIPQVSIYYLDDVCLSTDSIYCQTWTGLDKLSNNLNEISVYPNPTSTFITLPIPSMQSNTAVFIFNSLGEIVLKTKIQKGENSVNIDVYSLPKGIYFIRINNFSGRFIKS